MSLCNTCEGIGTWLLTGLDEDKSRSNQRYLHQPTWDDLQASVSRGCSGCRHIDGYFRDRGSHRGWYEHKIADNIAYYDGRGDWVERILEQQGRGEDTAIEISKGTFNTVHLQCGDLGFGDDGLEAYLAPGDPAAAPVSRLRKRQNLSLHPLSDETLSIVQGWMHDCVENHPECKSLDTDFFPSRVIDVRSLKEPRLVEREDLHLRSGDGEREASVRYVTLSHCWGKVRHATTTLSNMNLHKVEIPYSSLRKTFKDAISFTRSLGIPYIWIDSLCIIQDSPPDWEVESAQMGSIYANSFLNIAASYAFDGDQGFLTPRRPPCAFPYHSNEWSFSGNIWLAAWTPNFDDAIEESPLSRRGWVTQETLLPPRILHFSKSQLMWECRHQIESESGPESKNTKVTNNTNDRWQSSSRFSQFLTTFSSPPPSPPQFEEWLVDFLETWRLVVSDYTSKLLTFPSDKLPAISGIAAQFQRVTGSAYYAGLWHVDLPLGLCWEAALPCLRPSTFLAPSWSWASLISGASYPLPIKGWIPCLDIVSASVQPVGANPLGRIESGSLCVSGQLLRTRVILMDECFARVFYDDGEDLGSLEVENVNISTKPWCLLLAQREKPTCPKSHADSQQEPELCWISVLLLQESGAETDVFQRVGIVNRAISSKKWGKAERRVVTLV